MILLKTGKINSTTTILHLILLCWKNTSVFRQSSLLFVGCSLLAVMLALGGCKDDPINDEPEPDKEPAFGVIAQANIGPAGGSIATNNMLLNIPAACFSTNCNIEIHRSDEPYPEGGTKLSDLYYITGLPENMARPVRIAIRTMGPLSHESFVVMKIGSISYPGKDSLYMDKMLAATDSSGFLVAQIPPGTAPGKADEVYRGEFRVPSFFNITGRRTYTTSHFKVYGLESELRLMAVLGDALENTYDTLNAWKFDNKRTSWPMEVTIKDLPKGVLGRTSVPKFYQTVNSTYLEFSKTLNTDTLLAKAIAAHEYFHAVQYYYSASDTYLWLAEASSTWIEELFATNKATFSPYTWQTRELAPFNGLHAGSLSEADEHGYGMAPVFRYLTHRFGVNSLESVWKQVQGSKSPLDAIALGTDTPYNWWHLFLKNYIEGKVYAGMSHAKLVAVTPITITLNDTVFQKNTTMQELSGTYYVIKTGYANAEPFENGTILNLELSSGSLSAGMYIYAYTGNSLQYLGHSEKSFSITNYKELLNEKKSILVVVYNRNHASNVIADGSINMSLKGQLVKPVKMPYTKVRVGYRITRNFHDVCENGWTNQYEHGLSFGSKDLVGSFSGNTFTGTYDAEGYTENVRITINPATKTIEELTFSSKQVFGPSTENRTLEIAGLTSKSIRYYQLDTSKVCDLITKYSEVHISQSSSGTCTRTCVGYSCNDRPHMSVIFIE